MCDHKEWYALDIITKALVPKLEVHQQILQRNSQHRVLDCFYQRSVLIYGLTAFMNRICNDLSGFTF